MHIRAVHAAIGITAAITLGLAPAAPAHAGTTVSTELPVPTVADVAVTDEHVFLSGGADSDRIVVTDPDGTITGSIDVPGPTQLALNPDGRRLYVALPASDAIAVFDTTSLIRRTTYHTGSGTCPGSLAFSGTRLWFSHGCAPGAGNIGVVDLGRRPIRARLGLLAAPTGAQPTLAAAPGRPDLLVANTTEALTSYTVGHRDSLTVLSSAPGGGSSAVPVICSDGSMVYVLAGTATARAYRPEDLTTVVRSYPTPMSYGNGVAVSPDGRYVAVASQMLAVAVGVFVMAEPETTIIDTTYTPVTLRGRLVWSPTGTRLYAVTQYAYGPPPAPAPKLYVVTPALPLA